MISASVVISPNALIVVVPPKLNWASFKSTETVLALPITVVPVTPGFPSNVPILLIVKAEAAEPEALILKASRASVTPIVPTVITPLPLRRVRLSVPVPSALMVLVAKSILPSLPVPVTSVVIEIAPSITTFPSKSTSPSSSAVPVPPVPAVTILPFKVIVEPSILTSFISEPLPIPPVPTSTVPELVRVTVS